MKPGTVYIYTISDPRTDQVFYVGRSKRPEYRFKQHVREAVKHYESTKDMLERLFGITSEESTQTLATKKKGANLRKMNRIISILKEDKEPLFKIVDSMECKTESDANRIEDAWIAKMRIQNQPIVNYIYSRRQDPSWYSPKRKGFKPWFASSPDEYIEKLKVGEVGDAKDDEQHRPTNRRRRAKYSKKIRKSVNKQATKKNKRLGRRQKRNRT